jgi:hypothetical protein
MLASRPKLRPRASQAPLRCSSRSEERRSAPFLPAGAAAFGLNWLPVGPVEFITWGGCGPRAVKDALRRPVRPLPLFRAAKTSLVQTDPLPTARP